MPYDKIPRCHVLIVLKTLGGLEYEISVFPTNVRLEEFDLKHSFIDTKKPLVRSLLSKSILSSMTSKRFLQVKCHVSINAIVNSCFCHEDKEDKSQLDVKPKN